jgi:hypothetical protein
MPLDGMKGLGDDAKGARKKGFGASVQVGTRGSMRARPRGTGGGGGAGVRRKVARSRAGGGAEDRGRRRVRRCHVRGVGEEDECLRQTQVIRPQNKGLTLLPHHEIHDDPPTFS